MTSCQTCTELREAEKRATDEGDYSAATDCRVLLRRHAPHCAATEGTDR